MVVTAEHGSELAGWLAESAVVVAPDNPDQLAEGIVHALDDTCRERAARASALARTLSADVILPTFQAVLADAVAARQARFPRGLPGLKRLLRPRLVEDIDPAPAG